MAPARSSHTAPLALMLCALLGCTEQEPAPRPPDVILITIDTLRADHCSAYGYERPTTPFLDELASRSLVFENAYGTSSWTAPSMASLFTSLPARSHGVVRGFLLKGKVLGQDLLADDFETLAEVLAREGYSTFGVSTNAHLWRSSGFAQGFESFTELAWEDAEATGKAVRALTEELRSSRPFFLWVHYFDPHTPYSPREPWVGTFRAAPHPSDTREGIDASALAIATEMRNNYDSEIAYVDEQIRETLDALDLEDDPLLIVTSDHGESFFDHGHLGHGTSLFEAQIRIPMIVHQPGQTDGRRIEEPTSLVDLYPTILEAVGIAPPDGLAGVSLLSREGADAERIVVTELDRAPKAPRLRTLLSGTWKLHRTQGDPNADQLYDLTRDPAESEDVAASNPERLARMRKRWREWTKSWPRTSPRREVAPFQSVKDVERLRALGYIE